MSANLCLVLIIDDDPTTQRLTALLLQRMGVRVLSASDRFAALGLLQSKDFALVLIDMGIPHDQEGRRCLADLIKVRRQKNMRAPIIVLTAHAIDRSNPSDQPLSIVWCLY